MKRIAVVVVALVLIVAVVLPPLFGMRARTLVETQTELVGEGLAPYLLVDVAFDDWDVGWYSSTATVSLDVDFTAEYGPAVGANVPPARFDATLPDAVRVYHGPILTGAPAGLGWGGVEFIVDGARIPELRDFQDRAGIDHVARLGITVGLLGRTAMNVDIPAFEVEADGARIDFAGLEMLATLRGGGQRLDFDGEVGGFSVSMPNRTGVDFDRMVWSTTTRMDSRFPGLWLGGGRLDMARVRATGSGSADIYGASDIGIEGNSHIEADRYIATGRYEVGELRIGEVRLNDLIAELSLRYDAEVTGRLMVVGNDPNELSLEAATDLTNAMFRKRLTLDLDRFTLRHDSRSASATLAFEYRGDELADEYSVDVATDLPVLLGLVTAHLDMAFHRELFRGLGLDQVDATVRVLDREGVLRVAGEDYTLDLGFDGGEVTVNGEPTDLTELMGLFGGGSTVYIAP